MMSRSRRGPWFTYLLAGLVVAWLACCLALDLAERNVSSGPAWMAESAPSWPAGFLWGTATAAHQVEGGNAWNDWSRFETEPGRIRDGSRSGAASGHWDRVPGDIALMKELGANAYRLSIEWSRVEPGEGTWNEEAWSHYADEIRQLRAAGITPMVTLLHFTLPLWIADRGGLTAPDFAERFGRFAGESARRLGADVDLWCTVNEPNVQMYQGYVEGIWPPGVRDHALASQAFRGLIRAHVAGAKAVRAADPGAQVGAAVNLIVFDPASRWLLTDWIASRIAGGGFNWAFYDAIESGRLRFSLPGFPKVDEALDGLAGSADWMGINYYRRNMVRMSPAAPGLVQLRPGPGQLTDTGVEIYPEGLLRLVRRAWARYHLPIYITENGLADSVGNARAPFIRAHAHALRLALDEGITVRGYFHWSLVDNFEWAEGWTARFGLYAMDRATLERRPTSGAGEFARLAPVR